jgi:glucose-1-phosphate thymidylyltransferase
MPAPGTRLKGLVLAGGTGSRLRPLTYTNAKQLIPIANRPILFYALDALKAAGITEVGVIVGDTRAEVEAALGTGDRFGLALTYIPQAAPLGLAHAVATARDFLGDDPFLMYLGDNVLKGGVTGFVEEFLAHDWDASILLTRVPNPEQFGVAVVEHGRVVHLVEKPRVPPSDLALVGVYLFRPVIHEAIRGLSPSWRGEYEITEAIQALIDAGRTVHAELVQGYWKDTGRPEDVLDANRLMLDEVEPALLGAVDPTSSIQGRVRVEEGAVVVRSTIRGPAIIGSGAHVEDSFIGPFTSIGPGVRLLGTEVENSVILAEAVLEHVPSRVEGSLIGRGVKVRRRSGPVRALSLVLGDHSQVEVL